MVGYIYLTTNLINNKKYIGQHRSEKLELHTYKGSGLLLQKAFKKYGKSNFKCEVLEECETYDQLNAAEKHWISVYNATLSEEFYNIARGGEGHTCKPWNKGKRGVQKITQPQLDALEYGRHLPASEKLKQKLRDRKNLVTYTTEYRHKLSQQQLGRRAINNGSVSTYVKEQDIPKYLSDGWVLGLIKKNKK